MRWTATCLLGLLAMWMVSSARAEQPTVVLGIRSVDEILDDADFVGEAVGQNG